MTNNYSSCSIYIYYDNLYAIRGNLPQYSYYIMGVYDNDSISMIFVTFFRRNLLVFTSIATYHSLNRSISSE